VALETVRITVEKTGHADAATVAAIMAKPDRGGDLRWGLVLVALGFGFAALGVGVSQHSTDALGPMLGVAAFPIAIGLALVLLHVFKPKRTS
jgi:hypothetical protein